MKMKMKNEYKYIYPEGSNTFWVYSDSANIDYLITVEDFTKVEEAKEIADRETIKWIEANDESDPYWHKGYIEVVKEVLDKEDISVKIYVRLEEREDD